MVPLPSIDSLLNYMLFAYELFQSTKYIHSKNNDTWYCFCVPDLSSLFTNVLPHKQIDHLRHIVAEGDLSKSIILYRHYVNDMRFNSYYVELVLFFGLFTWDYDFFLFWLFMPFKNFV